MSTQSCSLVSSRKRAGFADVQVDIKPQSREIIASWKIADAENYAASAYILASKPEQTILSS
ncbi:MAG TPA: hypothetical protein ENN39_07315 [Desulfonatronum sp.]|nr:hypothetical protein [Desulfonatronum sp.]